MARSASSQEEFRQQISLRYETLSKRLQQVAAYVLDNPNSVALDTLAEISGHAKVPASTLIRFANAFGFSGFNEIKQMYRRQIVQGTTNYTDRIGMLKELEPGRHEVKTPAQVLNKFVEANQQSLAKLREEVDEDTFSRSVEILAAAESVHVVGVRRSYSIATYLSYALSHVGKRTFCFDGTGGMYHEQSARLREGDVLLAISFTPYAKETGDLVATAVKQGIAVIGITDSPVSPLARDSETVFVVCEGQVDAFRSQTASLCLAQSLVVSLAMYMQEQPENAK